MESTRAKFPFTDLHSFKDFVGFVKICAPDSFPPREGVGPSDQWSIDLAYDGLQAGLQLAGQAGASPVTLAECANYFDTAFNHYRTGNRKDGFGAMAAAQRALRKLPTR